MYSREWDRISDAERQIIEAKQSAFPIKVGAIARELGLTVKVSTLKAGISGEIRRDNSNYTIKVNRHDVKERQRFTIAHEIAHYLLHREEIGDGLVDDILYRSRLSSALEAQANRLAADIIMPWPLIQVHLQDFRSLSLPHKIEMLSRLMEVSTTAVKIRLEKK
tara:strand:- start:1017 stop:1508 length:492 start_codon:yes stop_codon:yes gene_type:complete